MDTLVLEELKMHDEHYTKQMEEKNDGGKRYIDENMTHLYLKHAASSGTVFIYIPLTTNGRFCLVPLHGVFTKQRVFY